MAKSTTSINPDLANQATAALMDAQRVLLQASALFNVLQFAVTEGDACHFDLFALAQIGVDITDAQAIRASDQAQRSAGVSHD